MKLFYQLTIIIFFSINAFGYEYLYVRDPRGWGGGYGTIEEAALTVKPKGAFAEVSVYMTFSARGLQFTHQDSLEVEFYFQVDKNIVFNDLWLWIGDDIMKALIMDRWTAYNIYENIVKRRRDPALLVKEWEGSYRLRIFPMAGDEKRKIKMTYLVPADLLNGKISIPLPTTLIKSTQTPLRNLKVITYPNQLWKNPQISGINKRFVSSNNEEIGNYLYMDISQADNLKQLNVTYDFPVQDGKFLNIFRKNSENYYQVMIPPSELLIEKLSKKVVFVTDYVKDQSRLTSDELLDKIKRTIRERFSKTDSFNLIFSNQVPYKVSNKWLCADSGTVENTFTALQNPVADYTDLKSSLSAAVDFIRQNGDDGKIFLLSSSDEYDTFQEANDLITTLKNKMNNLTPVYIADLQNSGWYGYYISNSYYWGNDYIYSNLSRITQGEYFRDNNLYYYNQDVVEAVAGTLDGFLTAFDINTNLKDGFTYGKFTTPDMNQPINLSKPVVQFGKYSGEFSGSIQVSGTYNSKVLSKKIDFSSNDIPECDSTLEQMWAGKHINFLEKSVRDSYSNELISEIVQFSVSKRVLSTYSAFLALEPNDTIKFCATCFDESQLETKVNEQPITFDTLKVQAYPNPFNSQTKIIVELPESYNSDQLSLKLYDIVGQEVRTFDPMAYANKSKIQLIWNGKNNFGESVASGIYLFVVKTPNAVKSLKLLNFK